MLRRVRAAGGRRVCSVKVAKNWPLDKVVHAASVYVYVNRASLSPILHLTEFMEYVGA